MSNTEFPFERGTGDITIDILTDLADKRAKLLTQLEQEQKRLLETRDKIAQQLSATRGSIQTIQEILTTYQKLKIHKDDFNTVDDSPPPK